MELDPQPVVRVRPRPLGVREVVPPCDLVDADLVTTQHLVLIHPRRDEAIPLEVEARLLGQRVSERVAKLQGRMEAIPLLVHPREHLRHPPSPVLSHREHEVRKALKHPAPDERPQRARREEPRFRRVDRQRAGADNDITRGTALSATVIAEPALLAGGPHRVVQGIVVGRVRRPLRRNHHAGPDPRFVSPLDLRDAGCHVVVDDRHNRDASPTIGARRTKVGQPAVVCPSPRHRELGVILAGRAKARAEGRRSHTADAKNVRVGEDHLTGDAVAVELPLAQFRVPRRLVPTITGLGQELLAEHLLRVVDLRNPEIVHRREAGEELVVTIAVLRIHVLAVLVGRRTSVTIGRDDQVVLHGSPLVTSLRPFLAPCWQDKSPGSPTCFLADLFVETTPKSRLAASACPTGPRRPMRDQASRHRCAPRGSPPSVREAPHRHRVLFRVSDEHAAVPRRDGPIAVDGHDERTHLVRTVRQDRLVHRRPHRVLRGISPLEHDRCVDVDHAVFGVQSGGGLLIPDIDGESVSPFVAENDPAAARLLRSDGGRRTGHGDVL